MKPPPFDYACAESLQQVFELLEQYGDDAKLLAGGQSLMPTLNMRLSAPSVLIDINRIDGLAGIEETPTAVRIGAMTRQVDMEQSPLIAKYLPLLAQALPYIAHPAIRNRGTLGGSLALADPAAELPACAMALDAECVLQNGGIGERRVAVADFFLGLYETALQDDEVLIAVEFPKSKSSTHVGFMELARRHGDYAMAGLAAQVDIEDAKFSNTRLVFFGVGERPALSKQAASVLDGEQVTPDIIAAAQAALSEDLDPLPDLQASAEMKLHLSRVLLGRVVNELEASSE